MKQLVSATAALLATTTLVSAGGIERGVTNFGVLFEEGDYVEFGITSLNPSVSGDYSAGLAALGGAASTGNMAEGETLISLSYKNQLTDQLAVGFFINNPYGAIASYEGGFYDGLAATWESTSTTLVLKYDINDAFSVYGGARYTVSEAEIAIPALLNSSGASSSPAFDYTATGERDGQTSFVVGAAYERPEIALRVALTYEQGFTHTFETLENLPAAGVVDLVTTTEVEMPQAITLDFQTGVAQNTLVFGSIRHVEWSVWEVRPAGFEGASGGERVTGFDNDTTTYRAGVAQRINPDLALIGSIAYEDSKGGEAPRLAPTDGSTSVAVAARYNMGDMVITGGVQYVMLGDAVDGSATDFSDNTATNFGITMGYRF